jgi:hypothetical protein
VNKLSKIIDNSKVFWCCLWFELFFDGRLTGKQAYPENNEKLKKEPRQNDRGSRTPKEIVFIPSQPDGH